MFSGIAVNPYESGDAINTAMSIYELARGQGLIKGGFEGPYLRDGVISLIQTAVPQSIDINFEIKFK